MVASLVLWDLGRIMALRNVSERLSAKLVGLEKPRPATDKRAPFRNVRIIKSGVCKSIKSSVCLHS